jgi:hypothetical protein
MTPDEVMEEIYAYREEQARHFNYDLEAIAQDVMKRQKRGSRTLVDLRSKKEVERTARRKKTRRVENRSPS